MFVCQVTMNNTLSYSYDEQLWAAFRDTAMRNANQTPIYKTVMVLRRPPPETGEQFQSVYFTVNIRQT